MRLESVTNESNGTLLQKANYNFLRDKEIKSFSSMII